MQSRSSAFGMRYGSRSTSTDLQAASYVKSDIFSGMTPAELLQSVRRRHGLTQNQLAARARTSQAAISRIERGLVSPSIDTLANLVDLMGEELQLGAEPIDYGHDEAMLRQNLERMPEQRIERQASWSRGMKELQNAFRR